MKRLTTFLFWCLSIQTILSQQTNAPYMGANANNIQFGTNQVDRFINSIGQDKILHYSGCYIISSVTATLATRVTNKKKAFWIGVGVGTALGIAKEIYDIKHGNPEWGDLAADVAGSVSGALVVRIRF